MHCRPRAGEEREVVHRARGRRLSRQRGFAGVLDLRLGHSVSNACPTRRAVAARNLKIKAPLYRNSHREY